MYETVLTSTGAKSRHFSWIRY